MLGSSPSDDSKLVFRKIAALLKPNRSKGVSSGSLAREPRWEGWRVLLVELLSEVCHTKKALHHPSDEDLGGTETWWFCCWKKGSM